MFVSSKDKYCPSCSTYHIWSSYSVISYFRGKFHIHNFRLIIYDHCCLFLCLICRVPHRALIRLICHLRSSFFMSVSSRVQYGVLIVWHIIYHHSCLCLCRPDINAMSVIYDNSSVLIVVYICVFLCTIGRTSRATFGIPAKRLNITIYPILYHWWFSEL